MTAVRRATFLSLAITLPLAFASGASASDDATVEAGRYLANVAGCAACHTGPSGETYAGGTRLNTPFGPLLTPNITPDEETGIGSWSRDDFEGALRRGVRKGGMPLYPAMPYVHYTEITDDDIDKLWAFVQSVPPVKNEVDVNQLPFPFNVRPSLIGWKVLYFEQGRFQPDSSKSDAWNRGAYIIDALAHCGACHTPRDALGGSIKRRALQGARIEEWYAPNISGNADSVIADWDMDRLVAFLSGESHFNHVALGSMQLVVDDLSKATEDDVRAIATYLKDQPATDESGERPKTYTVSDALRAEWEGLFAVHCASCHMENGEGAPGQAASLVGAGGVLASSPINVISVLLEGMAPHGDYGIMPSFRDSLTNVEIAALTNYVRTSWGNDASPNARPEMVRGLRNVTSNTPGVETAATCPNTAVSRVGDDLRGEIQKLAADTGALNTDAVKAIVSDYNAANPDATLTQRVVDLGGVYCDDIAKGGADQHTVVEKQLAFMNAVLALGDS